MRKLVACQRSMLPINPRFPPDASDGTVLNEVGIDAVLVADRVEIRDGVGDRDRVALGDARYAIRVGPTGEGRADRGREGFPAP